MLKIDINTILHKHPKITNKNIFFTCNLQLHIQILELKCNDMKT